jgi:hypothetical protein
MMSEVFAICSFLYVIQARRTSAMGVFYSAFFLKTAASDEQLRKRFARVQTHPEADWKVCNYGNDFVDGLFEGDDDFTLDLSARFGEVIFLCIDSRNDQFDYEHSREGQLLRKLCWSSDGSESTWLAVAGDREPWEDSSLFSQANLAKALEMLKYIVEDEGADDFEDRAENLRTLWERKEYLLEQPWPIGDAHYVDVIQKHFGLKLPEA